MIKNNILKQRISRLKNKMLKQGIYPGVVNRLILKKIKEGLFPMEAIQYVKNEKVKVKIYKKLDTKKKIWSLSKKSISWGLNPNR